jgi:SAM-dependent methyltransferase
MKIMGLGVSFLREIADLKAAGALDRAKRVVEIGAQQLADSLLEAPELAQLYLLFDRKPVHLGAPVGTNNFAAQAPTSRQLWTSLGLEYAAVDLVGDAIRVDLNREQVPPMMRGQFDLVINAGTTEHVANQDNAFRVIHDLCRAGGLMLHEVPCQGMMTHGLVSYNPNLFWSLARDNGYEIICLKTCADGECDLPAKVMEINARFGRGYVIPAQHRMLQGFTIRAALRKVDHRAFASPLDFPKTRAADGWSFLSRQARLLGGRLRSRLNI